MSNNLLVKDQKWKLVDIYSCLDVLELDFEEDVVSVLEFNQDFIIVTGSSVFRLDSSNYAISKIKNIKFPAEVTI